MLSEGIEGNARMTYEKTWKVLADLLTELRKRGEIIPNHILEDLRSAKTMTQILKADPSHIENIPRIETLLGNVESHLIFVAQEKFGSGFVDGWMGRLKNARRTVETKGEAAQRFIPGLPRGEHWMRVEISEDNPRRDIEKLAEEKKLSHKMQKNGYIIVFGDREGIKSFVRDLRSRQNLRKHEKK